MTQIKIFFILSSCLIFCSYAETPISGNKGIQTLGKTIGDLSQDRAIVDDVKDSCPGDCPVEGSFENSPLSDHQDVDDRGKVFFDLQFSTIGTSGERSFSSLPVARINLDNFITNYGAAMGMSRADVIALPDAQFRSLLSVHPGISGLSSAALSDAVDSAMIIKKMTTFSTADEAIDFAAKTLANESFSKKVSFLATYLDTLESNYEFDILPGEVNHGAARYDDDLHNALKQTIISGGVNEAGVCRHMHQMAIRMARRMGIDEAFTVGFRTVGSGHRTMVLTDPKNPGQVVQLNYGRVSETFGVSGVEALSQNGTIPDTGIRFKIYNDKDELVLTLPSELGGVLNRVSGGEDSDLAIGYQDQARIQQTGINTPYGTVRVFHAVNPQGTAAQTAGLAYNAKTTFNDVFYTEVGIAGFTSKRPTELGDMRNSGVYVRATQGANVEVFKGDHLSLRLFGEQHSRSSLFYAKVKGNTGIGENASRVNASYNLDMQLGASLDYQGDALKSRTSVVSQVLFDSTEAANGFSFGAVPTTLNIDQELIYSVNPGLDLKTGVGVSLYDLGTGIYGTYRSSFAVDAKATDTVFDLGVQGRLTRDTPFWLPAAEHEARMQVKQGIYKDHFTLGVEGRQSFDFSQYRYFGMTLGGRFGRP